MASGETLLTFDPRENTPPTSAAATFATRGIHPVYEFPNNLDTVAIFRGILPRNYAGGGITAYVHWMCKTVTSGNVPWQGDWENDADQDLDADGFTGSPQSATGAANATCGKETVTAIVFTDGAQIDSVAVGNLFRFKLIRNGLNAADTIEDVAQLLGIELKET